MANHFSALKRARQTETRTARNRSNTSRLRSALRQLRESLAKGDKTAAEQVYRQTVSALGSSSASQNAVSQGSQGFLSSLNSQRAQFSGVSVDNEMIQIMQFQNSYQAAARLISTLDTLFTTLTHI